jgi:uncharacterized protein (TIGR00369 family)
MKKQPGSRFCFVCGVENPVGLHMKFYEPGPGEIVAEITVPEHFQGYPGVVHGGIVSTMLDETVGRSQMGDDPNRFMVTAQLSIRYRKPVPTGQPLRILGHAGTRRGRVANATGEIFGPDGTLLAQAEAVLVDMPEGALQGIDDDVLGWKIYPDEEADK